MSTLSKPWITPEQYLEIEETAEYKSEYFRGEMFATAGATFEHNLVAANTVRHLGNHLAGRPCVVSTSDMRIHIPQTGLFTYADVVVVCGEPRFRDRNRVNLVNPTVIVEVLSRSTEAYDRGRKFENYQSIDSLREYLMITSDRVSLTLLRRQAENQWLTITITDLDGSVDLESAGCILRLRNLYENVTFPAEESAAGQV